MHYCRIVYRKKNRKKRGKIYRDPISAIFPVQKYEVEATRVYQERMKQYEDRKKEIEAMLKSAEEE